jgi:hypothetical protein
VIAPGEEIDRIIDMSGALSRITNDRSRGATSALVRAHIGGMMKNILRFLLSAAGRRSDPA